MPRKKRADANRKYVWVFRVYDIADMVRGLMFLFFHQLVKSLTVTFWWCLTGLSVRIRLFQRAQHARKWKRPLSTSFLALVNGRH